MNPMKPVSCRECRAHLGDYLDRTLPREHRTAISAHLDTCDACYAEYAHQRDMVADLRADLPGLGRLEPMRAGALWQAVQGELRGPRRPLWPVSQRRMSVLAVLIGVALVLPWLVSPERIAALSLPLPPTPAVAVAEATVAPVTDALAPAAPLVLTPPDLPEYAPTRAAAETALPASPEEQR